MQQEKWEIHHCLWFRLISFYKPMIYRSACVCGYICLRAWEAAHSHHLQFEMVPQALHGHEPKCLDLTDGF